MQTDRTGLWTASLVACGLFLAEDPAVIAARQHLRRTAPGSATTAFIDIALAAAMLGYNYCATRYVVRVASAEIIERALAELDAERSASGPGRSAGPRSRVRVAVRMLNPFNAVKAMAERAGTAIDRAGQAARRRGRSASAALLGDLAIVNLLGVPGAGVQRTTSGRDVTARDALRLCTLFVASWFVGAWVIELVLDRVATLPLIGGAVSRVWAAVSSAYVAITDVTTPVGAVCVASFLAMVLRTVRRVEQRASALLRRP